MIGAHVLRTIVGCALSSAAFAGQVSTPTPSISSITAKPTTGPDIIVQHRTDKAIKQLVQEMTSTVHQTQVAHWNHSICLDVVGLDASPTTYAENRIVTNAKSLKIGILKKPCRPNIIIVFTDDADTVTKAVIDQNPALFDDPIYGIRHADTFSALMASRPVRWIDTSRTGGRGPVSASIIQRPTREKHHFRIRHRRYAASSECHMAAIVRLSDARNARPTVNQRTRSRLDPFGLRSPRRWREGSARTDRYRSLGSARPLSKRSIA